MAWTPLELVITSPSVKKIPSDTIINEDIVLTSNKLISDWSEQGLYSSTKTSFNVSNNKESLSLPTAWMVIDIKNKKKNLIKLWTK